MPATTKKHTVPAVASPARRKRPTERPGQIIEAAFHVFGERGLARARIDEIAKRAGVAKGTIYLYFPTKDDLFRAMIRQLVVQQIHHTEDQLPEGSAADQLRFWLSNYWSFLRSPTFDTLYRLVVGELHQFPELARFYGREVVQQSMALTTAMIVRGVKRREFRARDPEATARMIASICLSHAVWCSRRQIFLHVAHRSDAEILAEISEFVFAALRPTPPTSLRKRS